MSNSPREGRRLGRALCETQRWIVGVRPPPRPNLRTCSLFATHIHSSFLIRTLPSSIRPLARGGRSAGGARMHARHPSRHAMTGMQTPLDLRKPGKPALRSLPHHGRTRRLIHLRKPDKPGLREASCVPSDGDARLSALHVGFLARARARRCPAFPPGSCGDLIRRTGHRYPKEQVSLTSPAQLLPAPGTPHLAPPRRTPPEAPLLEQSRE